jgi:5-methyltetrahydrofolate--homocysteine methyltransferase
MTLKSVADNLYKGEAEEVAAGVKEALQAGVAPMEVLNIGLLAGMDAVGRDFKSGALFLPEVLAAARAMKAGMDLLNPLLVGSGAQATRRVVIGTVEGDLHDIGKNLVSMLLTGAGFQVIDLGIDVSPERFVQSVGEHSPDILGLSALLTTTMPGMKSTIAGLEKAGLRSKVKVLVGGAPVTQQYAKEIGADAYAPDAPSAVDKARQLAGIAARS